MTTLSTASRPRSCPTCGSRHPHLHPATQHEAEVQPCFDPFHEIVTLQNTPKRIADHVRLKAWHLARTGESANGPFEAVITLVVKATGTDEDALKLIGNVQRFMRLSILSDSRVDCAVIEREGHQPVSINGADVPIIKM